MDRIRNPVPCSGQNIFAEDRILALSKFVESLSKV